MEEKVAVKRTEWKYFLLWKVVNGYALLLGFFGGSDGKESTCKVGDVGLGWGRSLGWVDSLEAGMATHSSILA